MNTNKVEIIEWLVIFIALVSLAPFGFHYHAPWYLAYLTVVMIAMVVVLGNRVRRLRGALREARRRRDRNIGGP